MEFFEVLGKRQSIRAYSERPVEEEALHRILEAAHSAPSAGNLQARDIFIVREPERRAALARAAFGQDFIAAAPVSLVFCTHPARCTWKYGNRGRRLYAVQDATIACAYAMLAATALGLSTVWVGAFADSAVHEAVGSPAGLDPVAVLPIGYAAENPTRRPRLPFEDVVHEI
ncbi:MAG TPA: nitroreductase family protein [Acidobacteriota bacterium]|nr:nitroreductase family protein [Acidobacteriota bacterium]